MRDKTIDAHANDICGYTLDDLPCCTRKWYFSKEEIEEHSPSRRDGIDYLKESHIRRSYCSFLKELGKTLKVPQMTIATAWMFCHRFFMRQSHAKNSWQIVAASSMFLSSKVEETPRLLRDVVIVSYEIINKHDTSACNMIRQKEIYEEQKNLILLGERLLMYTMAFNFNIQHPYKPLVDVLKSLEISHNDLARVAWNFVNDWLCTTLCLQFKPHYIAAGSLFLAAKMHNVKLPKENGKVWWHMFEVAPKQLELAIQEMIKYIDGGKNGHHMIGAKTSCSQESCISNGQLKNVHAESAHNGWAEACVRKRLREGEDFWHNHVDKKRITTL